MIAVTDGSDKNEEHSTPIVFKSVSMLHVNIPSNDVKRWEYLEAAVPQVPDTH